MEKRNRKGIKKQRMMNSNTMKKENINIKCKKRRGENLIINQSMDL